MPKVTPAIADVHEKIIAPVNLEKYPNPEQWNSYHELDGNDWKRGGIVRNGIKQR